MSPKKLSALLFSMLFSFGLVQAQIQKELSEKFLSDIHSFSPRIAKTRAAGTSTQFKIKETVELTLAMDLPPIPAKAWKEIGQTFQIHSTTNEQVNMEDENLMNSVCEIHCQDKKGDKACSDFKAAWKGYDGTNESPSQSQNLNSNVILSGITLTSENHGYSYYYNGDCDLINFGLPIYRRARTKIEVRNNSDQPEVSIYLEIDEMTWAFIRIRQDEVGFASSDEKGVNLTLPNYDKKKRFDYLEEKERDEFLVYFINKYIWRS